MVGRCISFWEGLFSGATLVSLRPCRFAFFFCRKQAVEFAPSIHTAAVLKIHFGHLCPSPLFQMARQLLLVCVAVSTVHGIDNGLGRTPPMGWRSWNLYGANVNQSLMQHIMDGMVSRKRQVNGVPTSLCDLGYCDVGLDDNWQDCKGGHQYSYHDDAGIPIINTDRFPDMVAMTSHAHQLLGHTNKVVK